MIDLADRADVSAEIRLVPHAFREATGRSATGVWHSPGVVGLAPGFAVCARWGAIVAGDGRDDGMLELFSINRPAESVLVPVSEFTDADAPLWAKPVARIVRELRPEGASLMCSVDLPAGAGVSSSDALACATALALRDLSRPDVAFDRLPSLVSAVAPTASAAFSGGRDPGDLRVLVIDTRIRRDAPVELADISGEPSSGELAGFLTEYHRAQKCEPEQDLAVRAALDAGAAGASMLVDEPGRPAVALVPQERLGAVRAAVSAAFRDAGLTAPRLLVVRPSPGVARVG